MVWRLICGVSQLAGNTRLRGYTHTERNAAHRADVPRAVTMNFRRGKNHPRKHLTSPADMNAPLLQGEAGESDHKRDADHVLKRLLIILAVVVVLGQTCGHEFNGLDDGYTIYNNPTFNPPTFTGILSYWNPANAEGDLWVPVTYTFWGILAFIARLNVPDPVINTWLNPWIFHSASVLLHMATALAVFKLIREIVKNDWAACAGAMVFAIHPVQMETVAWASGGKDLLCGLFTVLSALSYIQARKHPEHSPGRRRGRGRGYRRSRWASLLWMALGLLSKPTAVVTPVFLIVLDRIVYQRSWKQAIRSTWPWFVMAIPCVIWTKLIQPVDDIWTPSIIYRPLLATDALAFYMLKIVLPLQNCVDYGRRPEVVIGQGWLYYTWIAPALAALVLWMGRRRWPLVVAGIVLAAAGLLPVLGLVPFRFQFYTTVSDHYLYLPMAGIAIALAASLVHLPLHAVRYAIPAACIVLVALGIRANFVAGLWKDNRTLFSYVLTINPDSYLAFNALGRDSFLQGCYLRNLSFAEKQANAGEQVQETYQRAMVELGRADRYFRDACRANPRYVSAWLNLAATLAQRGLHAQAIAVTRDAMERTLLPGGIATKDTGMYARMLANLYLDQGNFQEAVEWYEQVLRIFPGDRRAVEQLEFAREKLRNPASTQPSTPPGGTRM